MGAVTMSAELFGGLAEQVIWRASECHSVWNPPLWELVCSDEFQALLSPELVELLARFLAEIESELMVSRLPADVRREVEIVRMRARREAVR